MGAPTTVVAVSAGVTCSVNPATASPAVVVSPVAFGQLAPVPTAAVSVYTLKESPGALGTVPASKINSVSPTAGAASHDVSAAPVATLTGGTVIVVRATLIVHTTDEPGCDRNSMKFDPIE